MPKKTRFTPNGPAIKAAAKKHAKVQEAQAVVARAFEAGAFAEFRSEIDRPEGADALAEAVRSLLGPALSQDLHVVIEFWERHPSLSRFPNGPPPGSLVQGATIRNVSVYDRRGRDEYLEIWDRDHVAAASVKVCCRPLGRAR